MPGGRAEPDDLARAQHAAADRLDAFWDDLVRTGAADLSAPGDAGAARASLVSYLDLLTPAPSAAARERVRRRTFAHPEETPMTAPSLPFPATIPNGHRRHARWPAAHPAPAPVPRWWHRPLGAFQVATTVALILATLGGILLLRPGDDRPSLPAASSPDVASGTPDPTNLIGRGESLVNVQLDGPVSGEIWVGLNRVTFPPGSRWDFRAGDFADVEVPSGLSVEAGTIAVGVNDREYTVPVGGNFGASGGLTSLRNLGTEPAVILLLSAHPDEGTSFAPPPALALEPIGNVLVPLALFPDDSSRLVILSRASFSGAAAPALVAQPQNRTIFVAVESGRMSARVAAGASVHRGSVGAPFLGDHPDLTPSTPEGETLQPGETLTVDPAHGISETAILGNDPVETLSLDIVTWTLPPPTPGSVAPSDLRWDVPQGSEAPRVGAALRRVTLEPDSVRMFDLDGVLAIHGVAGTVHVSGVAGGDVHSVAAGEFSIAERSGLVEIRNTDAHPATFIEGIVAAGEVNPDSWAGGTGGGSTEESLGTAFAALPPGPVTVSLFPEGVAAGDGVSTSSFPGNGFRLIGTLSGTFDLVRLAGEVTVQSQVTGTEPRTDEPALGAPVDVGVGDAVVAQPRSGYSVAADERDAVQLITLAISSDAPLDTASPGPRGGEAMTVAAADCQAEPRDIQTLYAILNSTETDATPGAGRRDAVQSAILGGTGPDVTPNAGPQDDAPFATPADAQTTEEVTATVRESLACVRFGTPLQGYELFTDAALRVAFAANGYTTGDIDAMAGQPAPPDAENGQPPVFAIDDVVVFPDGRAGAIVNANGEIVSLTFVQDPVSGRWLIDAWDEREPGTATPPTP